MIKAGLIGLGKMGISHYAILNAHPEAEVRAVCDTSGLLLGAVEQYGRAMTYKDYREMIREEALDCVVISTPTASHAEMVGYALDHDLHVFVEKPYCLSLDEGHRLAERAKIKQRVNQVGYHFRFVSAFQKVRQLLERGIIGDVYHFQAQAYGPVVLRSKGMTWRTRRSEGGGCLHDYASHVVNLITYLFGRPDDVGGTVMQPVFSRSVADDVFATLYYGSGLTGQLSVNWSDESYRKMFTKVEIWGTHGKIVADRQECMVYLQGRQGRDQFKAGWNILYTTDLTGPVYFYLRGEEYSAQMDYFVRKVLAGDMENVNSFENAVQTDEVLSWLTENAAVRR